MAKKKTGGPVASGEAQAGSGRGTKSKGGGATPPKAQASSPKSSKGSGSRSGQAQASAATDGDAEAAAVSTPEPKPPPKSSQVARHGSGRRVRPESEKLGDGLVSAPLLQALRRRTESARELARRAGVNPRSVQRFVSGERDLSLAAVDRLAQVLGLRLVSSTPIPSAPADS